MKASQLREKSPEELHTELLATCKERFNLRMQKAMGQAPKMHLWRQVKIKIARIKTIMKEKGVLC